MKPQIKHLTLHALTALLLSASVAITHAASQGDEHNGHRHSETGSNIEGVAFAENDLEATVEKEIVRERVRVGPRSKVRFVWRTVEPSEPAIERDRAPRRISVGPPSKTRGRNR